jgi:hypothetical protein
MNAEEHLHASYHIFRFTEISGDAGKFGNWPGFLIPQRASMPWY